MRGRNMRIKPSGSSRRVAAGGSSKGLKLVGKLFAKLPVLLFIAAVAGVVVAVPIAARAAYRYVSALPFLAVEDVRVTGVRDVSHEDFVEYMGGPSGTSIVRYDLDAAVARASAHPWIKSAVVRRDFPGSIRVEVVERTPAAIAATTSARYVVDSDGLVIAKVAGPGWDFLPVIQCAVGHEPRLLDPDAAGQFREAMALVASAKREPSETLSGAKAVLGDDGTPYLNIGGTVVKFGRGGYDEKAKRLAEVESDIKRRGTSPAVIDLRFPGKVIVKGGGAASEPAN